MESVAGFLLSGSITFLVCLVVLGNPANCGQARLDLNRESGNIALLGVAWVDSFCSLHDRVLFDSLGLPLPHQACIINGVFEISGMYIHTSQSVRLEYGPF
jgi:hypothetical protein